MHCDPVPRPRERNEAPAAAEQSRPEEADDRAPGLSRQRASVPVVAAQTLLSVALAQDLLTLSAVDATAMREQCSATCPHPSCFQPQPALALGTSLGLQGWLISF